MPGVDSGIFTTGDNISATNQDHIGKFVGLALHFSTRARFITACGQSVSAQWADGQPMTVADEARVPVRHIWLKDLGHANTVEIVGWRYILPSNTAIVRATSGLPAANVGINGELAIDLDAGFVYQKTGGQWQLLRAIGGGGGGALPDPPVNLTLPAITGNRTTGSTLTLSNGTWEGDPSLFQYQWYSDTALIVGETAATYVIANTDVGHMISGTVVASNGRNSEPAKAVAVEVVPAPPTFVSGTAAITGTARVGLILTASSLGTWANATGHDFEWRRDGQAITGATNAATYAVVTEDQGKVITVGVRGRNAGGAATTQIVSPATASVAAATAQSGTDLPASNTQTFDAFIGGRIPDTSYSFGASATALPALRKGAVINSLTAAGAAFKDGNDWTNRTKINSEAQVYTGIQTRTHRMGTDRLGLWAALQDGEEWHVPFDAQTNTGLPIYVNGTATPWSNLPATADFGFGAAMMGASVGQFVALLNKGIGYISSINYGASVTITALSDTNTGNHVNAMVALLPIYSAVCQSYASGSTTIQFPANSLSTKIKPGYSVARVQGTDVLQMTNDIRVRTINHATGTVTLTASIPLSGTAGLRVAFYPCIEAGQLWTRDLFDIRPVGSWLGIEWEVDILPGFSTAADADLPRTGSRWDLVGRLNKYPTMPQGAWPALWGYSGNDGSTGTNGTSEIDPMELFVSCTMGLRLFSTGNVNPDGTKPAIYNKTDEGWTVGGDNKNRMAAVDGTSMVGRHKVAYALGWEATDPTLPVDATTNPLRSVTCHFLDGKLIRKEPFQWKSARPLQLGMNMAWAWMSRNGAANFQFPMRTTAFAHANMDLLSLKVWCRTGPAA